MGLSLINQYVVSRSLLQDLKDYLLVKKKERKKVSGRQRKATVVSVGSDPLCNSDCVSGNRCVLGIASADHCYIMDPHLLPLHSTATGQLLMSRFSYHCRLSGTSLTS